MLLPHLLAALAFGGGILLVVALGTNRHPGGAWLGGLGGVAALLALAASLAAVGIAAFAHAVPRRAAVILTHLGALATVAALGGLWFGMHLA